MTKEYNLKNRTKLFAYSCLELCEKLPNSFLGNHVKGQLTRSCTSVAANYRAASHAQSKAAFVAKLSIVIEECDECEFWLELIIDKNLIDLEIVKLTLKEANELTSIFVVSRKTSSESLRK